MLWQVWRRLNHKWDRYGAPEGKNALKARYGYLMNVELWKKDYCILREDQDPSKKPDLG